MYCTYLFTHIDASTKSAAEGNESGADAVRTVLKLEASFKKDLKKSGAMCR